jgi:hypothetical protein
VGKIQRAIANIADVQATELFIWATISGDSPEAVAAEVNEAVFDEPAASADGGVGIEDVDFNWGRRTERS